MSAPHLQLRTGGLLFVYRVGVVALDGDRVLLHRAEGDDFWALPGGRVQAGETAEEAAAREMTEEIGVQDVAVRRLLYVVENFFVHWPLDGGPGDGESIAHHELGLYLEVTLPPSVTGRSTFTGIEESGPEPLRLEFAWFDRSELSGRDLRPIVVRDALAAGIPDAPVMLLNRD